MRTVAIAVGLLLLAHSPGSSRDLSAWSCYANMNYVTALAEGEAAVYVGTTGGIRRYDRFGDRWLAPLTTRDGLPHGQIDRMFYEETTGDLWFDTPGGTGRWISRLGIVSLAGVPPVGLHRPRSQAGVPPVFAPFGYYLEEGRVLSVLGPRRTYGITDVLTDSWRILWVGTWGLGVGRADLRNEQLEFLRFGPVSDNVTAIARDGKAIWFGGENTYRARAEGITRFRVAEDRWDYFESEQTMGLDDPQVSCILPDSADVWFGTPVGISRYVRSGGRWLTYRTLRHRVGRVTALARSGARLWVGTDDGLAVLDLQTEAVRRIEGSDRVEVYDLEAGDDDIWAGTDHGLFRCPRNQATWRPVADDSGLTGHPILAVSAGPSGVWAAVESPPTVIHLSPADSTWRASPLAGLSGSRRVGLDSDSARVWVGTAQGAFRLNIARGRWHQYTASDGLVHDHVYAVELDGNYVWFGTAGGISRLQSDAEFFEGD